MDPRIREDDKVRTCSDIDHISYFNQT